LSFPTRQRILNIVTLLVFLTLIPTIGRAQLRVDYYMTAGKRAIFNKEYPEAIQYFNSIIASYEDLYEAHFYRGVAKFSLGDFTGAELDFNKAIEIKPYYPKAYHYRALTKDRLKHFHEALQDYNKAIDQEPNSAYTYVNRGIAKVLLKYYYSAIEDCSYAIQLNANLENGYLCMAAAKSGLEDHEGAIENYNKALVVNRFNEDTYAKRGNTWLELKKYDEALADFNEALRIDSGSTFAYFNRAVLYSEQESFALALVDYNKVIELEPGNALALFNRAILKSKTDQLKAALEDYNTVAKLNPQNVLTLFNRANIKYRLDDKKGAIADYTQAILLFPNFSEAYYNRGMLRKTMNDPLGAQHDYQMARAINEQTNGMSIQDYELNEFIELEADFTSEKYNRDKIQNKHVDINPAEDFVISFVYGPEESETRQHYFYNPLNSYNKLHENRPKFVLVNKETKLSPDDIYTLLNFLNNTIEQHPEDAHHYFNRAVLKGRIEDYNGAIEDYDKAISLKPRFILAYFSRANMRIDLIDLLNSFAVDLEENEEKETVYGDNYQQVLNDFNTVIQLDSTFSYAFYNLANFQLRMNRFDDAQKNYTNAIALGNKIPEAYYNRGLTHIYLKNKEAGCLDLGKAGELGKTEAYNIIKRYCGK
jgi:tetratricopeptide (TPR) repeat protein